MARKLRHKNYPQVGETPLSRNAQVASGALSTWIIYWLILECLPTPSKPLEILPFCRGKEQDIHVPSVANGIVWKNLSEQKQSGEWCWTSCHKILDEATKPTKILIASSLTSMPFGGIPPQWSNVWNPTQPEGRYVGLHSSWNDLL